jgi:uracil phosphoribosyltransferase
MIADWGMPITKVKLLCVLASQEGLDHVQAEFPELEVGALVCFCVGLPMNGRRSGLLE